MELVQFILIYTILLSSIIGYGLIFSEKLTSYNNFKNNKVSLGYIGIFGILFLIFISYFTSLFFPHGIIHNLLIVFIGFVTFIYFFIKNKKIFINKYFIFAYLISFFSIFYFKSHDDFPYYHLSFINNLTENKIEFGINNFDIAFNHVSSLFYLHSLFKTFFTGHFFYQIGQLSIVIFINTILFENIFKNKKNNFLDSSFYLNIFFLIFINIFFYRLAEHGTDRSAQILFFLIFCLSLVLYQNKNLEKSIFEIIILFFTLIITLKSFYIFYLILFLIIYLKFFKVFDFVKLIKVFPIIYFCFFTILLMMVHNISSSGCFLYPVAFSCPDSFFWGYGKKNVLAAMEWYEIWSKAGASPNYRVEDFSEYLTGFNWVSNWMNNYFFNKVSDFFFGIIFSIIIILITFKLKNFSFRNIKKYKFFYLVLIFLLLEWFFNHPSLRYGGYVLIYLFLVFPFTILLENQKYKFKDKFKSIKIISLIIILVFASRNIERIYNENKIYNYNPLKDPNYNIKNSFFTMKNRKDTLFYDQSKCNPENSKKNIICKNINSYNFYFLTND